MSFIVKVANGTIFEWKDDSLQCSDTETMKYFMEMLGWHIPKVVAQPDLIDFNDDLTDGRNAYYAVTGIFQEHEVLKYPSEEFLDYGYIEGQIY